MKLTLEQKIAIIAPAYAEHAGVSLEQAKIDVRKILEQAAGSEKSDD